MGLDINVFGQTYSNIEGITVSAVGSESTYTYIVPSGTITVTATPSAPIDVTQYAEANITITPSLQIKEQTITPGATEQTITITPDSGYQGLSGVNLSVEAIPSDWTLITTATVTINENPTDVSNLININCPLELNISSQIIYIRVRYNNSIPSGEQHHFGTDNFYFNNKNIAYIYRQNAESNVVVDTGINYGIYVNNIVLSENNTQIQISMRFNRDKTFSLLGEYTIDIFTLNFPNNYPGPFTQTIQEG